MVEVDIKLVYAAAEKNKKVYDYIQDLAESLEIYDGNKFWIFVNDDDWFCSENIEVLIERVQDTENNYLLYICPDCGTRILSSIGNIRDSIKEMSVNIVRKIHDHRTNDCLYKMVTEISDRLLKEILRRINSGTKADAISAVALALLYIEKMRDEREC